MEKYMGIDIGGTNVKIGMVDRQGGMDSRVKYSTEVLRNSSDFVEGLLDVISGEFKKHPGINEIGMGIPGTLTLDRSACLEIAAIPAMDGVNLKEALHKRFPGKIFHMENDANAAALGEYYFSRGAISDSFIFVTLGTGIGSAAIINGRIFAGADGNGMELGHILSKNEKQLEENIGKAGILNHARELLKTVPSSISIQGDLDPKIIVSEGLNGDKLGILVFERVGELLGEALVAVIRLLDIKTILIGGGLSVSFDLLYDKLKNTLEANLTPYYNHKLQIRKASLGNNAGIIGAASLCFR